MNIKTGIKTLALALPMAAAPLKSGAQNITKQTEKTAVAETVKIKGGLGTGVGLEPFFNQSSTEPKLFGHLEVFNKDMNASLKTSVGQSTQSVDARLSYPLKLKNNLILNGGGYYKYNHISEHSGVSPIVLKQNLNESNIPLYQGYSSIGFYVEPKYAVNKKLNLSAKAEVGSYELKEKGSVSDKTHILSDNIVKNVKETGAVGNFELGAEYNINKHFSVGGNVNYSTLHQTPGFNVETKVDF